MSKRAALICFVSNQDGAQLEKLLLGKDYRVFGSSHDAQMVSSGNLKRLGLYDQLQCLSMAHNGARGLR